MIASMKLTTATIILSVHCSSAQAQIHYRIVRGYFPYNQEHIIEERGEYRTSVPSLRKVLWGQLGANTSESACG